MAQTFKDSVFWVETSKIHPNPYQPRKEFNNAALKDLSDSIKQYGVLQPLTVSRSERIDKTGGIETVYELVAGERRLRAAQLAGLVQVPVIIREGDSNKVKLELAIIENLQREDLNSIDRALAFQQLHTDFSLAPVEIARKIGKSREYVANTLRLLNLPDYIKLELLDRKISEGHTRPLLMLQDRPKEQKVLLESIVTNKLSVRQTELRARRIAKEKARKYIDPKILSLEETISEHLGTRVHIENAKIGNGGRIIIDYFKTEDLEDLVSQLKDPQKSRRRSFAANEEQLYPREGSTVPKARSMSRIFSISTEPYETRFEEYHNQPTAAEAVKEQKDLINKYKRVFRAMKEVIHHVEDAIEDEFSI